MSVFNHLYNEDCIKSMGIIPDESVDAVITDPPFAINFKAKRANYNRDESTVLEGYQEVAAAEYYDFTFKWMSECKRVLKESGSMMIVSGYNNMNDILTVIKELDLEFVNQIIWEFQFGVYTTKKFVASHYNIFYVCKNDKKRQFFNQIEDTKLSYNDRLSVWRIPREYWKGQKKTPTKLPRKLCEKMISYTTQKADTILDPFVGSGQVPFVAKDLGRNYIGYEIVKDYFDFANERVTTGKYLL